MTKKIFYIILAALGIIALVILMWWWFFRHAPTLTPTTGTFGTAQNANNAGGGANGTGQTNVASNLPSQGGVNGGGTNGGGTQTNIQLGQVGGTPVNAVRQTQPVVLGQIGVPNVAWLSGAPTTPTYTLTGTGLIPYYFTPPTGTSTPLSTTSVVVRTTGPGTVFNPTGIVPVETTNPGSLSSIPNIGGSDYGQQQGGGGLGLLGTAAIAAGAGALYCGAAQIFEQTSTVAGVSAAEARMTAAVVENKALTAAAVGVVAPAAVPLSVATFDVGTIAAISVGSGGTLSGLADLVGSVKGGQVSQFQTNTFLSCIARVFARVALQQITNSVVNWINSGFNGSPSFVQDPTKFLTNTADVAAGAFIKSSALSFLCSPFQLQIKIAIAQSYANRNANSCTLTQVTQNINNFMRGGFFSGGWRSMLSFTGTPTNNPYGAFMFGSVGISLATQQAQGRTQTDLLQGQGFLSFQQKTNCSTQTTAATGPNMSNTPIQGPSGEQWFTVCKLQTTTPGTVIAQSLGATEKSTLDQLTLAKSFDEIISALISQLMVKTLQGGLSNLSGQDGYAANFYTPDQLQAQTQMQTILTQMEADTALAQQYGGIQQGSITDIQSVQNQLNSLYNCWAAIATTTSTVTSAQVAQAATNAALASTTIAQLNVRVNGYNNHIVLANNAITLLNQLESQALSVASTADVNAINTQYQQAKAAGTIPTQNDITTAQQSRTTLQNQMSTISQQATVSFAQCNAIH